MPLEYGTVIYSVTKVTADRTDTGAEPDVVPVSGYVTFTPSEPVQYDDGGVMRLLEPVRAGLDVNGVLRDGSGNPSISLVATDSAGMSHLNWTWEASFRLLDAPVDVAPFPFLLPAGTIVNLNTVAPAYNTSKVVIIRGAPGQQGQTGPKGDPGVSGVSNVVVHGSAAGTARPAIPGPVVWVGSATPTNKQAQDVVVDPAAVLSVNGQTGPTVLLDHTHVGAAPAGDYATRAELNSGLADKVSTANVSTVGLSGAYVDLTGKPDIAETALDAVGAALLPGENVTITVNDATNEIVISASSTASTVPQDGSVTDAKVAANAAISADKLADGTGKKVMTAAERTKLAGITEGATVYTDEQARDAVSLMLVAGTGINLDKNDAADTVTVSATGGGAPGGSALPMADQYGLKTWTFDPMLAGSSQAFDNMRYYFARVLVTPGQVLTGFRTYVVSVGSGVTLFRAGLHAADGSFLRQTENLASVLSGADILNGTWQTSGGVNSPYTVPAGVTALYLGICNVATTGPTIPRVSSVTSTVANLGLTPTRIGTMTAQSDVPASIAAASTTNIGVLLAAS